MKISNLILVLIGTLTGCTNLYSPQSISFKELAKVAIDESGEVISRPPSKLTLINDSLCMAIVNDSSLNCYNYLNGKLVRKITFNPVPFDSIIKQKAAAFYPEEEYIFDIGLTTIPYNLFSIGNVTYDHKENKLQVIYYRLVHFFEVKNDPKTEFYGHQPFVITCDLYGKTNRLTTLSVEIPENRTFYPSFEQGFFCKDSLVLISALIQRGGKITETTPTLLYFKWDGDILTFKNKGNAFYPQLVTPHWIYINSFCEKNNQVYVSNQKQVFDAFSGKLIYQGLLEDSVHENLTAFNFSAKYPDLLLYRSDYVDEVKGVSYTKINAFDTKNKQRVGFLQISALDGNVMDFYKDKAVSIQQLNQNYYFVSYEMDED